MYTYSIYFNETKSGFFLYIALRGNYKRATISTGIKENPDTFNKDSVKFTKSNPSYRILNEKLSKWIIATEKAIRIADIDNLSLNQCKDQILKSMGLQTKSEQKTKIPDFMTYFDEWINTDSTKRGKSVRVHYRQTYNVFTTFLQGRKPQFDEMTNTLCESFISWMNRKGLSTNTRGGHIKSLKACMNEAYINGLHTNIEYKQYRKEREEVDSVYLSEDEINKLWSMKLSGAIEKTRDLFLVGCYTGLRWSDYSRVCDKDIEGRILHNINIKTNEITYVPVHPRIIEILNKYNGRVPQLSQQKFNENLKDLCRRAEINQPVQIRKGSKIEYYEKWELISSHTARRTGLTNMYLNGIDIRSIMKISGHRNILTCQQYLKVSTLENAKRLIDNDYFNEK